MEFAASARDARRDFGKSSDEALLEFLRGIEHHEVRHQK
jgi:hypothetical protein